MDTLKLEGLKLPSFPSSPSSVTLHLPTVGTKAGMSDEPEISESQTNRESETNRTPVAIWCSPPVSWGGHEGAQRRELLSQLSSGGAEQRTLTLG